MTDFRTAIREYVQREALPPEKYSHQPRLYELTKQVGAGLEYDDDVVFAAAWLHDLGVFSGHRPADPAALAVWDNTAYAMRVAPDVLRRVGFPEEKIAAVVEAIRTHQPSGEPVALEGVILRDADILEQLGAVGVLRTVCKIGRDTRFVTFEDAIRALRAALDVLPGELRLPGSRTRAEAKVSALRNFLDAVDREAPEG